MSSDEGKRDKKGKKDKGAGKTKKDKRDKKSKKSNKSKKSKKDTPKKTCCVSKPRCRRCPIRMLAEGRLDPADAKVLFQRSRNRKQAKKAHLDLPVG
ncbi:hypothetical protein [Microbacterium karelineae]|uniref:hypothetical protein n=1 Tax=Microbacterium karelineae TaxID=2654283 RepID=UPI0012E9EA58|nr:hypothetical protein [Microbacterium karelineae]